MLPHCAGMEARAVAVAAFPEVLLFIEAGRSDELRARNVGVAGDPVLGPAKTVLAAWVRSWGASVPFDVMGEPETMELKIMPSPFIPTLVTVPELPGGTETNMVRTSVIEEIAVLAVTTVAIGILADVKPVVFDDGAQLPAVLRYT